MIRPDRFVLLMAAMVAVPASSLRGTGAPGPRVWSQYEVARAAAPDRIALDRAAQLSVAREYGAAFELLGSSRDSLRAGILACKAGQYRVATDLLGRPAHNPYLEWLRLYYYAKSLCAEGRYAETESALDTLRALGTGAVSWGKSRNPGRARDLLAEVTAKSDSLFAIRGIPNDARSLSPRPLLLLSQALLDAGRDSSSAALCASIPWWKMETADAPLFVELLKRYRPLHAHLSPAALYSIGREAINRGLYAEAEEIVDFLLGRDGADPEALLCKALLLQAQRHPRKAIDLYDTLFNSAAPQWVRREAISRSISLEYELKNDKRAVEKCLRFAQHWPDRGSTYVELAARIEISRGNHEHALALLNSLRPLRRYDDLVEIDIGPPACETALRLWRGDSAGAYGAMKTAQEALKAFAHPTQEADVCYWLSRTSPSDSERVHWAAKLLAEHPNSFQATDLGAGLNSLVSPVNPDAVRARIEAMAFAERRLIDSLSAEVRPDDSFFGTPVYRAYSYLLDRGLIGEASECYLGMQDSLEENGSRSFAVYERARDRGLYAFAIWTLNMSGGYSISEPIRMRLSYPVAFAHILARDGVRGSVPPEVILAVMREESKFDPYATSRDGAQGLMQLMPATARWIARTSGVRGDQEGRIFEPEFNIETGCRYLEYLLERFDGSLVGALAAYNGGEGKMAQWKRTFDPSRNSMAAIELIGPLETRVYVEKVLSSICVYRSFLHGRMESP